MCISGSGDLHSTIQYCSKVTKSTEKRTQRGIPSGENAYLCVFETNKTLKSTLLALGRCMRHIIARIEARIDLCYIKYHRIQIDIQKGAPFSMVNTAISLRRHTLKNTLYLDNDGNFGIYSSAQILPCDLYRY